LIVNWKMYDGFDANGKFWTDSNSLMMMERELNTRKEYQMKDHSSNISSNYYPVTSAIAMRDDNGTNRQVTIMTERPQGGSVDLSKGSIELMQSRRLTEDDNKGVIEPLNETDSNGQGLQVNAKYFMQIFDYKKAVSKQREQQILIDQPLQYFFAFTYDQQQLNKT